MKETCQNSNKDIPEADNFFNPEKESDNDERQESVNDGEYLYEHYRFTANNNQSPLRIDKFLIDRLPHTSRNRIQLAAEAGCVLVNGQAVKSNYRVKPLDVIAIVMSYPIYENTIIPEDIPLNIVYEDEELLVVNKPAGLVVHPGHGNYTGTLVNALAYHLKDDHEYDPDSQSVGLVHRIDKDTSGLLVIAKRPEIKTHLSRQFFNKTTRRKYIAMVWGTPDNEGTIEGNIGRDLRDRMKMAVFPDGEQGKQAVTHYKIVEKFGYVSRIECSLETGRTHQIRVHLKYIGHPVFNDERYGGNLILKGLQSASYKQFINNCFETCNRQALHAKTLGFVHPKTGKEMFFDSELPEDMTALIDKWRKYYMES
ncbi:MAG: RluA family pseudouridine synthase [Tannerella sp.]|jgi:23S rRNA pseudouridine1911/1915/1917 synthase|nr:RluA family pseudouridine synthase [Tannerella sp.]